MKIDANCFARTYHKGNAFWNTGSIYSWLPGAAPEWTGWKDEQMSWKETCYIGDWTLCLNELWVKGPDALRFCSDICTNSFENFTPGKAKHYIICDEAGYVQAEGILLCLAEQEYLFESNGQYPFFLYNMNPEKYPDMEVRMPDYIPYQDNRYGLGIEADLFKFQVSGPKALELCQKVADADLTDVKFMNFKDVTVDGVECFALRQGMAGEIGFEIQGPLSEAAHIFDYIFEAGEEFGCRRLGARTGMINHLEACFPTYACHYVAAENPTYDDYQRGFGFDPWVCTVSGSYDGEWNGLAINPFEAGWGMCVKFDHDFIGRAALEEIAKDVKRKVVTLEFNAEDWCKLYESQFQTDEEPFEIIDMPMNPTMEVHADKIFSLDGKEIGVETTPGYSYYFRKVLALSFVDVEYAEPGTEVKVLWGSPDKRQCYLRATVQPAPYKTDNRKTELKA